MIYLFREVEEGAEQEPRLYALKRPEGCEDPLPSVLHPITATTEEVLELDHYHLIITYIFCRLKWWHWTSVVSLTLVCASQ